MSEDESEAVTSSSSEEEDEDAKELTLEVEKKFLKTLQSLKTKDPAIYDANVKFFDVPKENETESADGPSKEKSKQKKARPFLLTDYDKLLVKSGGEIKEESDITQSYNEEQESIKSNLKKALLSDDSDDDSSLFTLKPKVKRETDVSSDEETEITHWLTGEKDQLKDKELEQELKPLHDIWTNPELDDGETFLRDYILNKRYKDKPDKKPESESDEQSSESDFDEKQEEFEHKYNFRFEEPDQEFIKRYPRTMEASMRRKESKRKLKREQAKKNKEDKLEKKKMEMKKLKSEKREDILSHLKHLKKITGNQTLAFKNEMLEGDFDPDQHDKIMEAMFNEEFYAGQDEEKPVFEEDGEEYDYAEYEAEEDNNEEDWNEQNGENNEDNQEEYYDEFANNGELITDCDYDPTAASTSKGSGRKLSRAKLKRLKRKEKKARAAGPQTGAANKSLFAQAVEKPKPLFNPKDGTFMKYVDEYYGLEFEDLIGGDLPCRFKYKKVVPNSYGLSIEEILAADDKELNKWCPVKKIYSQRSEHVEKNEVKVYTQRARDENLKKKLLPSLYKTQEEVEEEDDNQRILPTEDERKEMMTKKQKKIQQISEEFENEKQKKKNEETIEDVAEERVEKEDVIDESIVNEYLREKKRNVKTKERKRTWDNTEKGNAESNVKKKKVVDEPVDVSSKNGKNGKKNKDVGKNSEKDVDKNSKKKKKDVERIELEDNKTKISQDSCDELVENGQKEGGKKKKRKKKKKKATVVEDKEDLANTDGGKKKVAKKGKDAADKVKGKSGQQTNVDANVKKPSDKKQTLKAKIAAKQSKVKNMKKAGKGDPYKKRSMEKVTEFSDARLKAYGINPKKFKSKLLYGNKKEKN